MSEVIPIASDHAGFEMKQKLVAETLVGEQSTQTIVARLENIASNHLPPDYYATMAQRYTRITAAQLLTVARRYLRSPFATVYEGPLPLPR